MLFLLFMRPALEFLAAEQLQVDTGGAACCRYPRGTSAVQPCDFPQQFLRPGPHRSAARQQRQGSRWLMGWVARLGEAAVACGGPPHLRH